MRPAYGFAWVLAATLLGGIAGYFVTWLVPRTVGFAGYAPFAVFWASFFFFLSALSGIQQEITRATHALPTVRTPGRSRARTFGLAAAFLVLVATVACSPLLAALVFPAHGFMLVAPLAVGASSYVVMAVVCGTFYGLGRWHALFAVIVIDALGRAACVGIVLLRTTDVVVLAWAVALPVPASIAVVWPFVRKDVVGRAGLDVDLRQLSFNVLRTFVAAAAMGTMVSGFPALLAATANDAPDGTLGQLILAATFTRAPLMVVAMALQSWFILGFRSPVGAVGRTLLRLLGIVVAATVPLLWVAFFRGPLVFSILFPGEPIPDGRLLATLVLSSALVSAMFVTSTAVLARAQHVVYSVGWAVGSAATVMSLFAPLDLTARTQLSLIAGPIAGLLVNGTWLFMSLAASRGATSVVQGEAIV